MWWGSSMPLAFLAIGAVFLIAGIRGTVEDKDGQPGLITLLKSDFTGTNSFLVWIVALWVLGALGYIPGFKPLANAFLLLVLVVLILANDRQGSGGFFATFNSAIRQG